MMLAWMLVLAQPQVARPDPWPESIANVESSCSRWSQIRPPARYILEGKTLAEADAAIAKLVTDSTRSQRDCLARHKSGEYDFGGSGYSAEQIAAIDKVHAGTEAELTGVARRSRQMFLDDPAKQTGYLNAAAYDRYQAEAIAYRALTRAIRPHSAVCGSFDYNSTPSASGAGLEKAKTYHRCLLGYGELISTRPGVERDNWRQVIQVAAQLPAMSVYDCGNGACTLDRKWTDMHAMQRFPAEVKAEMTGFAPYRCATYKQPGCIDEGLLSRMSEARVAEIGAAAGDYDTARNAAFRAGAIESNRFAAWFRAGTGAK